MQHFSPRDHKSFYRNNIAEQIAVSAGADFIYMGFFHCRQSAFVDWWKGRGDCTAEEPNAQKILDMVHEIDRAILEAERCPNAVRSDAPSDDPSAAPVHWAHTGGYLIGVGAAVDNILPVIVVVGDAAENIDARNAALCIGMSYVRQELNETVSQRPKNSNDALTSALSMLSVHFAVVDSQGEIEYSTDLSEELLQRNGGFQVQSGRLVAPVRKCKKPSCRRCVWRSDRPANPQL